MSGVLCNQLLFVDPATPSTLNHVGAKISHASFVRYLSTIELSRLASSIFAALMKRARQLVRDTGAPRGLAVMFAHPL